MKDVARFAVAVALLLVATALWTSDRYQIEAIGDGWDSLRLDKHTGEVCGMRFGVFKEGDKVHARMYVTGCESEDPDWMDHVPN